jgi:3'-phosphoadenosine 5'-phosphosulfate sulfotransferase (PAPS reductase)/FAD synthetase
MITLPAKLVGLDLPLVVSVSGGKDSTACLIALREAGLPFRAVFADTGWEAPETYAYLDALRGIFGPIDTVRAKPWAVPTMRDDRARRGCDLHRSYSPMADQIVRRAGFPARMQRWCTRELKLVPLRAYHDAIGETVSVVGVRASESSSRAKLGEVDDDEVWGGWVWRPLIAWSERDVYEAHRRANVPLNPLYERGHDRVGCFPCIHARKDEVRLVAEHAPERIDEIRAMEAQTEELRTQRNADAPGRYEHMRGTFFRSQSSVTGRGGFVPIDEVVAWSRTSRGGRQMPLLADPPSGGCFRLGFCEPPQGGG